MVVGKTTMPEFGAFPYTESVSRGITRNPWDPARTPGGSSGGTAVAVATGMVPVGMGGDGGGSIRIPSACCGLFGLKPQRGRVTTAPHPHLWFALGTAGPLTRSVLDSAIVYDVVRGNVDRRPLHGRGPRQLRRGGAARARPAAHRLVGQAGHARASAPTRATSAPSRRPSGCCRTWATTSARSTRATRTRQRPSCPSSSAASATRPTGWSTTNGWSGAPARPTGWAPGCTPRVIEWALEQTESVSLKANRVFDEVDVLLTPAIAHRPPKAGILDSAGSVESMVRSMPAIAYAAIWNVAGNPAAAVPCGIADDGLPIAVQLVGRPHDETTLLSLSAQLEAERPWPLLAG